MNTDLSSATQKPRTRPCLFLSQADLDRAKVWAGGDGRELRDRFIETAREDRRIEPPVFETAWWEEMKDKKWEETYPPIFHHTFIVPAPAARAAARLARVYALTGDREAGAKARDLLIHFSDYTFRFEHYDVGMNYSIWAMNLLGAYDLLFDELTPDERAKLDACFSRFLAAIWKNDQFWIANNIGGGINNHLAWHKYAIGSVGLFYDRGDLVDYALHSDRALIPLLETGMMDDGLWCESSLNYHFAAIAPIVHFAEALENSEHEIDLYNDAFANGRALKQALDSMIGVLFPDGSIPSIGDCYARKGVLAEVDLYEFGYRAWKDPRYAWLLSRRKERSEAAILIGAPLEKGRPPAIKTALYPEHGYVFLRNKQDEEYWDNPGSLCAMLTFDRSGVHANADGLSLMLHGRGRMLLPDCEAKASAEHAFSSDVQGQLNRSSHCHNLVLVDGMGQQLHSELLDLVEFRSVPGVQTATVADLRGQLYNGVRQQRTVHLTGDYLLDVYQIASSTEHRYQYLIHALDPWDEKPAERIDLHEVGQKSLALTPWVIPAENPWRWLRNGMGAQADRDWTIAWRQGRESLRATVLGGEGTAIRLMDFPRADGLEDAGIPMVMAERSGKSAVFAVVYTFGGRTAPEPGFSRMEPMEGSLRYNVSMNGSERVHLIPPLE